MRRFSSCRSGDEGVRRGGNCGGRPMLDGRVASEGTKSIGNVGNESGSVQRGSRLSKTLH